MGSARVAECCAHFAKATNAHAGGFGFYVKMEEFIKDQLNRGLVSSQDLVKITISLMPANIGSTDFQRDFELFLIGTEL